MEIKERSRKRRNARNNRRKKANRKLAKLRSVVTPTLPDQMIKNEGASAGILRRIPALHHKTKHHKISLASCRSHQLGCLVVGR